MQSKINLMKNLSDIGEFWTVASFLEAYQQTNALIGCSIASISADPGNPDPDKIALITCRTFIENGVRAKDDQKYVVGIRFYTHGDMATIDVISLDKGFHKDICFEHLKRMGWPLLDKETGKSVDKLQETAVSAFLFVGGHLEVENDTHVNFFGSSGDYGDNIFFSDSNAIAAYVASICGIELGTGDKEKGEAFIQELLEFMLKHKTQKDFYEQLVQEVCEKTPGKPSFTAQHIGALITMKVMDRVIAEEKDVTQMMIEEIACGGLSRYIMLSSVVKRMKEKIEE